jgi:hypothetical protein
MASLSQVQSAAGSKGRASTAKKAHIKQLHEWLAGPRLNAK